MDSSYRIRVFGKPGCDKCAVLNRRLDQLLEKQEWADFGKEYCDLETEEGLMAFCDAECVNPQRLPAMLVMRKQNDAEGFGPIPNPSPDRKDPAFGNTRLYQHLGLQTDYSGEGRGVITPKMITALLNEARH